MQQKVVKQEMNDGIRGVPIIGLAKISATNMAFFTNISISKE